MKMAIAKNRQAGLFDERRCFKTTKSFLVPTC